MNKNQDQELDYRMDSVSEKFLRMLLRKFQKSFRKVSEKFLMPGFPRYSGKPWAMSLRRKKRWRLGKLSRRSIFLQRRNIYRRQKMNYLRKDR